jgi:hypothetical protein
MRKLKTEVQRIKTLSETAGEFLVAALSQIEEQLDGRIEELGEVSVIFTWNGVDYRFTLSRYLKEKPTPRKTVKKTISAKR